MSQRLKVPALFLVVGLVAAACSGEAESAADSESEAVAIEAGFPAAEEAVDASAVPPAAAPPRAATPLPRTDSPASSAATGGARPPQSEAAPPPAEEAVTEVPSPEPPPVAVPAGARIHAVVDHTISTRSHRTGDVFQVRITDDVLAADGMVLVPEGAVLEGKVMEARGSTDAQEEAVLVLGFETLVIRGVRFPFHGTVVETELEADAGDSATRSAAKVATGAAAGAILGQVLGRDTRSTVGGAVVGAAAGAGVALTTREGHAVLREGSTLVVQVDQPVVLVAGH